MLARSFRPRKPDPPLPLRSLRFSLFSGRPTARNAKGAKEEAEKAGWFETAMRGWDPRPMLTELVIRDLALIEAAEVELAAGLNALTGETGAGKSLFVGALEFLRGATPRGGAASW